jgi:hypothetical protein
MDVNAIFFSPKLGTEGEWYSRINTVSSTVTNMWQNLNKYVLNEHSVLAMLHLKSNNGM